MQLVDTHCHLNTDAFKDDWREVAQTAKDAGVSLINNVGVDLPTSRRAVELAELGQGRFTASIGLHPTDTVQPEYRDSSKITVEQYRQLAASFNVKAIGEVGLDYFHLGKMSDQSGLSEAKLKQLELDYFLLFLDLAKELRLSQIFHCRDAYDDFFEILKSRNLSQPAVVHFYIGSPEMLKKLLDLGLYIGFTGVITYPNTQAYEQNIRLTPLDRIVLETDAPFVAPQAHRGKRNEPAFVVEVAKRIAMVKQISLEEVAKATTSNAQKLLGFTATSA